MSDVQYPVLPSFESVHAWNIQSDIYKHGTLLQQTLKLFRHLGEISEGVQKMHNLEVSSGIGKLVVSLVGAVSFGGITPKRLAELCDASGVRVARVNPAYHVNDVAKTLVDLTRALMRLETDPENDVDAGITEYQITELFARLKGLAHRSGLVFDRSVINAATTLYKKKGKLDEFGIFQPDYTDDPLIGALDERGVLQKHFIVNGLKEQFAVLVQRFQHEASLVDPTPVVRDEMNRALQALLEKHITSSPKWKHLLHDRKPGVVVVGNGEALNINPNDDLQWLFLELEKVR